MSQSQHRPSPYQIQAFAHTVREGSVSAAARNLGITQSAVSQQLKKLETATGTKLLIPTKDGMALTRSGEELYALADGYLAAEQMIVEKCSDLAHLRNGHLSIIANAPQPAMSVIRRFCDEFPGVQVNFSLCDWTSAMRLLNSRTVDIGIVTAPTENREFISTEITKVRYVLYMREDHPLAGRKSISLQDMAKERVVLPEAGSLTQRVVSKALAKHGLHFPRVISMTSFPVMKDAILQGIGVGPFLANSSSRNDGLVTVPIDEINEEFPIKIVMHREKAGLHLIERFLHTALTSNSDAEDDT